MWGCCLVSKLNIIPSSYCAQPVQVLITNSYVRNRDDCVPLFPPIRNVTVNNITCECGNGLVPCVWPPGSIPGHGGEISDVAFSNAKFIRSSMAIAIKSLPTFAGAARNISYSNIVLDQVLFYSSWHGAAGACVAWTPLFQ